MKPLRNLKVLDLTQRLPGPLATYHLQNLGAQVFKVEDPNRNDPFLSTELKETSPLFYEWYENINSKKTIIKKKLSQIERSQSYDVIITTLSKNKLMALELDKLSSLIITLKSDAENNGMHDLNALARLGVLSLYVSGRDDEVLDPPFLPIAGVGFSYEIALTALAHLFSKTESTKFIDVTMFESIQRGLTPLVPSSNLLQQKHLHNGAFPVYNLYRLKDGHYAALACIEEHYFKKFCTDFKLHLPLEARFDTTGVTTKKLCEVFLRYTYKDLLTKASSHNYCLSLVQNPTEKL